MLRIKSVVYGIGERYMPPNKEYPDDLESAINKRDPVNTVTISSDLPAKKEGIARFEVPENITLKFSETGCISIKSGDKVTIKGVIKAEKEQHIFKQDKNGKIELPALIEVYPQWWGAKGDGIADDRQAFQQAIDSLINGGTISLPTKTYMIGKIDPLDDLAPTALLINRSNIYFKGNGATLEAKDRLQRILSIGKTSAQDLIMRISITDFRNWRQLKGYQLNCVLLFIEGDNKVIIDRRYFAVYDGPNEGPENYQPLIPEYWAYNPQFENIPGDKVLLLCQEGGAVAPNFMEFKEIKNIVKGTPTTIEFTEPIRLKPEWSNIWYIINLSRAVLVKSTFDPNTKFTNKSTIRVSMNEPVIAGQFKGCKLRRINHDLQYVFCWDEVPGNDDEKQRLREFLIHEFHIYWVNNTEFTTTNEAISASFDEKNNLLLKLDKTEVSLKINGAKGVTNRKYTAKTENRYVFCWNDVPGNDNTRLSEYLIEEFRIYWVKKATFISGSNSINASAENNSLSLKLDDTEVSLEINGVIRRKFMVKKENKLNIYENSRLNVYDGKEKPEERTILHNTIVENYWMDVTVEKMFSFTNVKSNPNDVEIIDDILVENITVEDIKLHGKGRNDTRECLYAKWAKDLCLKKIDIQGGLIGCQLGGIWVGSSEKCTISNCNQGFNLSGCNDLKISENDIVSLPVFCWNGVPGNDDGKLKEFLDNEYHFKWVWSEKFEKDPNKSNIIKISTADSYLQLRIDIKDIKDIIEIKEGQKKDVILEEYNKFGKLSREQKILIAKKENGYLNLYKNCIGIGIFNDDPSGSLDIYKNTITDCDDGGIFLNRVFHGRISGNELTGNGFGVSKANLILNSVIYSLVSDNTLVAPTEAKDNKEWDFVNMKVYYGPDYPMIYKDAYLRFVGNTTRGAGKFHGARFNNNINWAGAVQPHTAVHNIILENNKFEEDIPPYLGQDQSIDYSSYGKAVMNEGNFKLEIPEIIAPKCYTRATELQGKNK